MQGSQKELAEEYLFGREKENFIGSIGMWNMSAPLAKKPFEIRQVQGWHILTTDLYFERHPEKHKFTMAEWEILTLRLSALLWRSYNGPINMMTDQAGAEFLEENKLDICYNDIKIIPKLKWYGINQKKFWAAGKIIALQNIQVPCAILDWDMLIWETLNFADASLVTTHIEHIDGVYYCPPENFDMSPRYTFPAWDFTTEPLNTSLLYIKDWDFKEYYVNASLDFMQNERNTPDNGSNCMIFAEQRILAMCARKWGIVPRVFLDYDNLMRDQHLMTHIWVGKPFVRGNNIAKEMYIDLCRKKLAEIVVD